MALPDCSMAGAPKAGTAAVYAAWPCDAGLDSPHRADRWSALDPHELVDLAAVLGHVAADQRAGLPKLGPGGVAGRCPRSRVGI